MKIISLIEKRNLSGFEEELKNIELNEQGNLIDFDLGFLDKNKYKEIISAFKDSERFYFLNQKKDNYLISRTFLDSQKKSGNSGEYFFIVIDSELNYSQDGWFKKSVEFRLNTDNFFFIGLSKFSRREFLFIKEKEIKYVNTNYILTDIEDSCDLIMESAENKDVFVFLNLKIFSFGDILTPRQVIYLLQRFRKMKNFKGISVSGLSEMNFPLCAKIISEVV